MTKRSAGRDVSSSIPQVDESDYGAIGMKFEAAASLLAFEADLSDILLNSGRFDADWYIKTFPDVKRSGLQAHQHFLRYGQWLGRGLSRAEPEARGISSFFQAIRTKRKISYCIPIMNRPDDIKSTLKFNIDANRQFSNEIEFIICFLDNDIETQRWVFDSFASEIRTGYLRVILEKPLPFWHFGRAKNKFRRRMLGDVYSSLDGDNFVTEAETEQLLELLELYGNKFVFHHFSGNWGDGTSGRVSLPKYAYERIGYDERFFPRQFDEIDILLSIFTSFPDMKFIRHDTKDHAFSSKRVSSFAEKRPRLPPSTIIIESAERQSPGNPRGANYVQANPLFGAMLDFNQATSFWKSDVISQRNRFSSDILKARWRVIDTISKDQIVPTIVTHDGKSASPSMARAGEISLFSCVKDDEAFLLEFYNHYSKIGVSRFFFIDDGSKIPVSSVLKFPNVHVFRPEVGVFFTGKGMWLEALIKRYLQPGMWALTVDADEFLDVTGHTRSLLDAVRQADDAGHGIVPAILVDMVPKSQFAPNAQLKVADLIKIFDHHAFVEEKINTEYESHRSIQWGFGKYATLSWSFDLRYHAFGTFDSLRKIPLFKFSDGVHLNQGFHDLHYTNGTKSIGLDLWKIRPIMTIRHFKTIKLFEDRMFNYTKKYGNSASGEYHERTAQNISRIFGDGQIGALGKLERVRRMRYDAGTVVDTIRKFCGSDAAT